MTTTKNLASGDLFTIEHIRSEVLPRDGVVRSKLNCAPPFGADERPLVDPVRDELLACSLPPGHAHPLGKRGLAADMLNGAFKRGDVIFLHERRQYTRNLVDVNKESRFTGDRGACTVLHMTAIPRKSKAVATAKPKRERAKPAEVGPDGRTLPQRVTLLMNEQGLSQAELARMCSEHYRAFVPGDDDPVKQQHIFNILRGQESSWALPLIAAVFDVNVMWLQYGIGKREPSLKH